jgi:hypothetical protein
MADDSDFDGIMRFGGILNVRNYLGCRQEQH